MGGDSVDLTTNPLWDEAYDVDIPALQERGVEVTSGYALEELLVDPAHVNPGQHVHIAASARPGARFVVRIHDHGGGLVAAIPLIGDGAQDSTYVGAWTATGPGVYEVVTARGFPAELGAASVTVFDPAQTEVGERRALLVQDPADRRDISGFFPLVLARPRSVGVRGGRGGGESIWANLSEALGELANTMSADPRVDARVAGSILFDNAALLGLPWAAAPIPHDEAYVRPDEADAMARYLRGGGFLFLENAWGLLWDDPDISGACLRVAQDVMASAGMEQGRDWEYERLPQSHALYHCYYDFDTVPTGYDALMCAARDDCVILDHLEGITIEGRLWVLVSQKGYLLGIHDFSPGSYYEGRGDITPMLKLCANTVVFALTQEGGMTGVEHRDTSPLPARYALAQNVPNPFNAQTSIPYDLPDPCHVTLTIYAVTGQKVATVLSGHQQAGHREVVWDGKDAAGRDVGSGVYVCRMTAGRTHITRKMLLLR